jgi:hypothetical protein
MALNPQDDDAILINICSSFKCKFSDIYINIYDFNFSPFCLLLSVSELYSVDVTYINVLLYVSYFKYRFILEITYCLQKWLNIKVLTFCVPSYSGFTIFNTPVITVFVNCYIFFRKYV